MQFCQIVELRILTVLHRVFDSVLVYAYRGNEENISFLTPDGVREDSNHFTLGAVCLAMFRTKFVIIILTTRRRHSATYETCLCYYNELE